MEPLRFILLSLFSNNNFISLCFLIQIFKNFITTKILLYYPVISKRHYIVTNYSEAAKHFIVKNKCFYRMNIYLPEKDNLIMKPYN